MDKWIQNAGKIWQSFSAVGVLFLLVSALVIVVNVILRRFFNAPIYGSTEIVRYMAMGAASFSIIENEWSNGNVSMPLIIEMLSKKIRDRVLFAGYAIISCVFLVLDFLLTQQAVGKFFDGSFSQELKFALWIPSAVLSVGFIVLTLVLILKVFIYAWMIKTGNTVVFEQLRTD
jgi:TRAP-type C4-dicarboxylate transport system permease small subunit